MAPKRIQVIIGGVYGRLTVLREAPPGPGGHRRSVCRCECGAETIVANTKLVSGHTKSCGCLTRENKTNLQHGESYTRLHRIWSLMKARCFSKTNPAYKSYGGRGITVCPEWAKSYTAFAQWAKANGYTDELTIDRIDVNGDYEPSNCRFIPFAAQSRNRRSNHLISYKGRTMCLAEWARELGLNQGTLETRLNRYHWDVEHAFTEPAGEPGRRGKQRPFDLYNKYPELIQMFGDLRTYPALATAMAEYIHNLTHKET